MAKLAASTRVLVIRFVCIYDIRMLFRISDLALRAFLQHLTSLTVLLLGPDGTY